MLFPVVSGQEHNNSAFIAVTRQPVHVFLAGDSKLPLPRIATSSTYAGVTPLSTHAHTAGARPGIHRTHVHFASCQAIQHPSRPLPLLLAAVAARPLLPARASHLGQGAGQQHDPPETLPDGPAGRLRCCRQTHATRVAAVRAQPLAALWCSRSVRGCGGTESPPTADWQRQHA